MKTLPVALLAISISTSAFAGCGGGGYSAAGMTPSERLAKLAEVARGEKELAEINRRNANLDKMIVVAKWVDTVIGVAVAESHVPFGGIVYNGAKSLTAAGMGDKSLAKDSAVNAAVAAIPGPVGSIAGYGLKAFNAGNLGIETKEAFSN